MKSSTLILLYSLYSYTSVRLPPDPFRMAYMTSPTRDFTFNFSKSEFRYSSTVLGLTNIFAAISL